MKVMLLTGRAGYSCQNDPGDIIDVSDKEGKALIATGQAEYVKPAPQAAVQTNKSFAKR